jgi:hypothetical protein
MCLYFQNVQLVQSIYFRHIGHSPLTRVLISSRLDWVTLGEL